jgi:AcrR family transcriptional regulator
LVTAARRLFVRRGFSDVSTSEIVVAAGVTRNALYYHFPTKEALFRAVYEDVERETADRIIPIAAQEASVQRLLRTGSQLFLDACLEPDVAEISVRQAPAVLGFPQMREIDNINYLGALEAAIKWGVTSGELRPLPVQAVASMLLGALDEAALLIASAKQPRLARRDAGEVIDALIAGLAAPGPGRDSRDVVGSGGVR